MDSLTEFNINYPLYIYFTYSNLTGQNLGGYTCELFYNTQTDILITSSNLKKTFEMDDRSFVNELNIWATNPFN